MSAFAEIARAVDHSRRRWIALAVIVTAQFMVVLDVAIVNVALPTIKDRPALQPGEPAVGRDGVLDPVRRRAAARRADGRSARAAPALHGGPRRSSPHLAARRARVVRGLADRVPHAAGLGAALVSPAALSILTTTFDEGPRTQPRARHLGRGLRQRRRRRRAARRRADELARAGRGSSSSTCRSASRCSRSRLDS